MANGGSIPPFPLPSNQQSANSYPSQISSHKISTNGNSVQKIYKLLEYRQLYLDNFRNKTLKLLLKENRKTGRKFFKLTLVKGKSINMFRVPMPEDGYTFLWGMDDLMGELASGNIDPQEFKDPPQQMTTAEFATVDDSANSKQMVELRVVEFIGQTRNFQLGLVLFSDSKNENRKGEICFEMRASPPLENENGKWNYLTLPLHALPWLRREMAEMLIKYDGTEQIEEATRIPRKFLRGN